MDAGGGKLPYSYAGQQDGGKLVKSVSRVEPRRFGLGLVAGFLLVTCAYFSTAKFDAIQIAMSKQSKPSHPPSRPSPRRRPHSFHGATADSFSERGLSLRLLEQPADPSPAMRAASGSARWRWAASSPPPTPTTPPGRD
jgi:hypothetical protein